MAARRGWNCRHRTAPAARCGWRSRMTGRASRPSSSKRCSSPSAGWRRAATGRPAAPGSACRSPATSAGAWRRCGAAEPPRRRAGGLGQPAGRKFRRMEPEASPMVDRIESRLERLGLAPEDAARQAGLPVDFLDRLRAGKTLPPRGKRLVALAEALATSVSYLVGLDPDTAPRPSCWRRSRARSACSPAMRKPCCGPIASSISRPRRRCC